MMKKSLVLLASAMTVLLVGSTCHATVLPSDGPGQIGYTGVVLCDSLSVRQEPSSASEVVQTLRYGDRMMVMEREDGWAQCMLSDDVDAKPAGWVNAKYVAIDPTWYRADDTTVVYAWNSTDAKTVAQLGKGEVLPILNNDGDWIVVSLRGASGWIHKTDADSEPVSSASEETYEQSEDTSEQSEETDSSYFTVYAQDGSTAEIRQVEAAVYEDTRGRTFMRDAPGVFFCMATATTYRSDPSDWDTIGDGEGAGLEDNWANVGDGEGAGLEDNWANVGDGEGAGLEDNWANVQ